MNTDFYRAAYILNSDVDLCMAIYFAVICKFAIS